MSGAGRPRPSVTSRAGSRPVPTSVLEWPGRTVFVKAVGADAESRLAGHPPPRGGGLGRAAAVPPVPAAARRLRRRRLGGPRVRARRRAAAGISLGRRRARRGGGRPRALHATLTPPPAPCVEPAAVYFRPLFGGWAALASGDEPPAGARCVGPPAPGPRWPSSSRTGPPPSPVTRSSTATCGLTTSCSDRAAWSSSTGPMPRSARRCSTSWRGRPSVVLEGGPAPEELLARPPGSACRVDPDVPSTVAAGRRQRVLRGALAPPAATRACRRCAASRPPRVRWPWAGSAAAPAGDGRHGGSGAPVGSAACASDCRSRTSPPASHPAPSSTASLPWRPRPRTPASTRCG